MSVFASIDPDDWIASNTLAFAVRDLHPVSPGHCLVIPRREVTSWWETSRDEKIALADLIDTVRRRLDVEHSPDGYNIGIDEGTAAGRSIDHLHVHVIPRYLGDVADPTGGVRHVIPGRGKPGTGTTGRPIGGPTLVTPFEGKLKLELLRCLMRPDLDRIDLVISFVMRSGVDLLADHIDEALALGAHIRLLTTDYLQITDTGALGFFLDRAGNAGPGCLEARVFSDPSTSFHPKAYIFSSSGSGDGVAFVGSSNLSRSGISTGVEWNIETRHISGLISEFDALWNDPRIVTLTAEWLAGYAVLREQRPDRAEHIEEITPDDRGDTPHPWSVQIDALAALEATRAEGRDAGLVVMATGLGKTWLGAFDSTRPEFRRVLFVAHREEILTQARDVYRRIRPTGSLTMFTGTDRDPDGDVVFASIQSLQRNLSLFSPEHFDYIVVDEFHHAAAPTYRRVLAHFNPRFVLGLTATPDRADAADLLALCSDNLVYECDLTEGIRRGLLSPFAYRAIADVADYEHIPWRSGRFDPDELTRQLATVARSEQVFDEWTTTGGADRRCLAFCCTIAHAEFMAEQFRSRGVAAVAVHSGAGSAPRAESLGRLADADLDVIFTVDLFNEGVDVPDIDLVLILRPTESPVVFFQQLGRGLRRSEGKERLEVIDLVGNHRSFLAKARLLAALAGRLHATDHEALDLLRGAHGELTGDTASLPDGCSIIVETQVIDLLTTLAGPMKEEDRLLALARQWMDDHGGRRPTALELSLVHRKAFKLDRQGGWFGFLERHGMLSAQEAPVVSASGDFLAWIENARHDHGYTFIAIRALARSGSITSGMPVRELATICRWEIMGDADLRAELHHAGVQFTDVTSPTPDEWIDFFRRGPIHDLTTSTGGAAPFFSEATGTLSFDGEVVSGYEEVFHALVTEIVDYRLHRHLVQRASRAVGEERTFSIDGEQIDSTFTVESSDGIPTSVVIKAAGGTRGSKEARNSDYGQGFDVLLERLQKLGVRVLDIYIDTARTRDLSISDRRLDPAGHSYPLDLHEIGDLVEIRKALLRSMGRAGQAPGISSGGNSRKRTRFVISVDRSWTAVALADALASGDTGEPTATGRSAVAQDDHG